MVALDSNPNTNTYLHSGFENFVILLSLNYELIPSRFLSVLNEIVWLVWSVELSPPIDNSSSLMQ